jgi:glycosyltransferase involved in cell wall biosynthesis
MAAAGLRILLVVHGFPPETLGGTEQVVEALAREFLRAGHEVTVAAGSLRVGSPQAWEREDHDGLPVLRLHRDDLWFESWWKAYQPGVSAAFRRLLDELRPQVVHVHHWLRLTTDLVRAARERGVATAVTLHDHFAVLARPTRRIGEAASPPASPAWMSAREAEEAFHFHRRDLRAEVQSADLRLVPSAAHARSLREIGVGDLGAFRVQPPPLLFKPGRLPPRAERGRRLVTWGTLYEEKGVQVALQALRLAGGGWSLDVLGAAHDAGHQRRLEELAGGLPVRFHGAFSRADLQRVAADYALLPAISHESYGLVLDEARCLGLPVLASDVPAYVERGDESCRFFTAGDPQALAALLRDEERLRALPAPRPVSLPEAGVTVQALLEAYARALAGGPAPVVEDPISDAERIRLLFLRAERRTWSAPQQQDPPPPS